MAAIAPEEARAAGLAPPPSRGLWGIATGAGALVLLVGLLGVHDLVEVVAVATEALFVIFFFRHASFALSAFKTAPRDLTSTIIETGYLPPVTVLVACKNEAAVIGRLVASLLALDYPASHLQIILIDDGSTDGSGPMLDELARREPRLDCLHRPRGAGGGKSGALNDALGLARGEIVVVFDADHSPRPDVLRRLVRHFEDASVGAVQGRCEVQNADETPLTRLVAIDYLAGYLVNEYGRQSMFCLPAYGGANCAVRTEVLRTLGGWNVHSVTEDTDLTMRVVLSGARVRYDVTAVDGEEGVVSVGRYWRQRYRWARGHQQAWRDYGRAVRQSPVLRLAEKIETTLFLLAFHLPIASAVGVVVLGLWLGGVAHPALPFNVTGFWMLLFLGPLVELGGGLLLGGVDRRWASSLVFFLPLFLLSAVLCTKAWLDASVGRPYSWVKTQRSSEDE